MLSKLHPVRNSVSHDLNFRQINNLTQCKTNRLSDGITNTTHTPDFPWCNMVTRLSPQTGVSGSNPDGSFSESGVKLAVKPYCFNNNNNNVFISGSWPIDNT